MAQQSKKVGDHRQVTKMRPRSDPIVLCPLPKFVISGTPSLSTQAPKSQSLSDSHLNHFCGFNHQREAVS